MAMHLLWLCRQRSGVRRLAVSLLHNILSTETLGSVKGRSADMRGGCLLLKWLIKVEFKKFAFSTLSVAVELSVTNVGNEELGFKTLNHFPEVLWVPGIYF